MIYRARLQIEPDRTRDVEAMLDLVESDAALWRDDDRGQAWIELFADDSRGAAERAEGLAAALHEGGVESGRPAIQPLEDRDWQEAWKEHFHVMRVSAHIIVAPTWETCEPPEGVHVVRVDPGMSFGTGQHPTTRTCIELLDALASDHRGAGLIDVGCGSGILSIAATRLGYVLRDAFDHDPLAVQIARDNLVANEVDPAPLRCVDLGAFEPRCTGRVVVANMLAVLLQKFREAIVSLVEPDERSRLVLGGMLDEQVAGTVRSFVLDGLTVCDEVESDGWRSICFRWAEA